MLKYLTVLFLCGLFAFSAFAQDSVVVITSFQDDFEDGVVWEGWDVEARSHTLTEADGVLNIAIDKPSDAEKWDGLTMDFGGDSTLLDIAQSGGYFSVDLKADADCIVDIALWDITGTYNPGKNQIQLTGGEDLKTFMFEYVGSDLLRLKWNGDTLGVVDASQVDHLLMTFNGGSAWTGNVWMDNMKLGDAAVPPTIITSFEDDFEDGVVWEGWDMQARSHTLTEADGVLNIAVDKPSDAEKWDGLTMGFGDNTLIDIAQSGGYFSVDLKADDDCTVDIALWDITGTYNPGKNQIQLTGGEDLKTFMFEYVGSDLLRLKWNGDTLGVVDASQVDHLLMTFNGGSAWTGNVWMDNLKLGEAAIPVGVDMIAKKAIHAPVVDGNDRDGEWSARNEEIFTVENLIDGEMDSTFAASFRAAFDDEKFYVVVQVTDDELADNENQDQSDYIDLLFDIGNEDNTSNEFGVGWSNYDSNDWQIKFRRGQPQWIEVWTDGDGNSMNGQAIDLTQVDFFITDKGGSWLLEASIPWDIMMPGFTPSNGARIGFDINVGDADSEEGRKGRVGWVSNTSTYKSPDLFGTVELATEYAKVTGLAIDFEDGNLENWKPETRAEAIEPIYQVDAVEQDGNTVMQINVNKPGGLDSPPGSFRWTAVRYFMDNMTLADLVENPYVTMKMKSDTQFKIQIGLATLNTFGNPTTAEMTAFGDGEWHIYEFDFSAIIKEIGADASTVHMLFFNFDAGSSALQAQVSIDDVMIGDQVELTGVADNAVPQEYALGQNYPNPFNPTTAIEYSLPKTVNVSLNIYDITGRLVRNLVQAKKQAGLHTIAWDGKNNLGSQVASGIYIYQIKTKDFSFSRSMLLLK